MVSDANGCVGTVLVVDDDPALRALLRVAEEALRRGADRYLEKPFHLGAILEAVRETTRGRTPAGERVGS